MVTPLTQKIIIGLVVLAALGYFGYSVLNTGSTTTTVDGVAILTDSANQDILVLAERLKAITFDQSIFSSNLFMSLIDYETPIYPEPQGRSNPFAPIGTETTVATTTRS